jgi:hypothetical protein
MADGHYDGDLFSFDIIDRIARLPLGHRRPEHALPLFWGQTYLSVAKA